MEYTGQTISYLLQGAAITLKLWALTILFSMPIATVVALVRVNNVKFIGRLLTLYTNLVRGTPLMLQLYVIYFVLPIAVNIKLDAFTAALITFVMSWVAYINEILRIGFKSIERWQYDSAKALGMTYFQTVWYIVLPQVFWRSSAAILNEFIDILYNIPIVAIIGLEELLKNAKVLVVRSFDFSPFIILAGFYLLLNSAVMYVGKKIENRLTKYKLAETRS
jgi:polar amino acid transport system permease protein